MPVFYFNKKLIPVPNVVIKKNYIRTGAGHLRRPVWNITVNGILSVHKGSPDYNGDFWTLSGYPPDTVTVNADNRLAILTKKQGALVNLFADKGKLFEIQSYDGTAPIKFIPRAANVTFEAGKWFDYCNYTIEMETDFITFGSTGQDTYEQGDDDVQETWQIEQSDEKARTYKITHTVTAQANDYYNSAGTGVLEYNGWELAKQRASFYIGYDTTFQNNFFADNIAGFTPYNHALQESIDEGEGRYTATETWLLFDGGSYIEDYTVTTRRSLSDGQITVSIDGTVTGFSTAPNEGFADRYTNAGTGWTAVLSSLYSRATSYSGITLNINPYNLSIGRNPNQGVISYNYEYNNRFNGQITGAMTENISINDSLQADIFAIHRVVARAAGPIIQDIITNTEKRRTLTITANMSPATTTTLSSPPIAGEITALAVAYTPTASEQGPYVERNEEAFDYYSGRYSRTISWVFV